MRGITRLAVWLLFGTALPAVVPPASAANPTVVGTGTASSCTRQALASALLTAPPGATVVFNCGPRFHTIGVVPELGLVKDVTIDGGGRIALSGGHLNRVLQLRADVTAELRNLTIRDGLEAPAPSSPPVPGPQPPPGPPPLPSQQSVTDPTGDVRASGGGIENAGTLTIRNSIITANAVSATSSQGSATAQGGGIFNHSFATLTVVNSIISGNSASAIASGGSATAEGGGIVNEGTAAIQNSVVGQNTALASQADFHGRAPSPARGGGIVNNGTLTMRNTAINGNTATATATGFPSGGVVAEGGGMSNAGTLTIMNGILSGNAATATAYDTDPGGGAGAHGGGIFNEGTLTIVNGVLATNHAMVSATAGAVIAEGGGILNIGALSRKNTIVVNNTPDDCVGC
jgi:hypothetical protein